MHKERDLQDKGKYAKEKQKNKFSPLPTVTTALEEDKNKNITTHENRHQINCFLVDLYPYVY